MNYGSAYLEWVKARRPARFNVASSGVVPCQLSDLVVNCETLDLNDSGDAGFRPLQECVAVHCGVAPDSVVLASGTSMANFIAMTALIEPGAEVLVEYPVYEPLLAIARYCRAEIKRFVREDGVGGILTDNTRLVVLTNLHNPSCSLIPPARMNELCDRAARTGALVLVDEVYLECLYGARQSAFRDRGNVVCTGSLTKAYGLGGLRCGWIIADPDLARRMRRMKDLIDPSAPHVIEQLSVAAFRELPRLAERANAITTRNRAVLSRFLESRTDLELSVPQYGTCVFPRLRQGSASAFCEALHNRYETDIVPGEHFEKPDHFRLGIGGDTGVLTEALSRIGDALEGFM